MSNEVSQNLYRPSWLAHVARVFCWPLALFSWVLALIWRLVAIPFRAALGAKNPDTGGADAWERFLGVLGQGFRYLTFQTNEIPPLDGRLRAEGVSHGPWHEARRRLCKSHVAMASSIGFVLYVYVGVLAQFGVIAGDYDENWKDYSYVPPGTEATIEVDGEQTERTFLFGTDGTGFDVLSVTLRGTTTALWIGVVAALLSCMIGVFLGALAGYFGGWVDDFIVWLYTTLNSIPYLLLLLAFAFVVRNNDDVRAFYDDSFFKEQLDISIGLFNIILAIGLTSWVGICRIVRAEFIKHRDRDYVVAARSLGYGRNRIMFKHILPNVFHLVLISFSLLFVSAIKFEVILSFLGMGLDPGEASWGAMISQAKLELIRSPSVWWQITAATGALFFLVLFVNLFADALRDALDPRLRV